MTTKILRARLLAKNIDNSPLEVKFYDQNLVSVLAGTLTKNLAETKDILFTRRDGRGQLPFYSTSENGSVTFNYVVSRKQMSEINKVRNKINLLSTMLKEGRGIDIDELVKLEYELPNDFTRDLKTRQGQHKRYAIVLDIKEGDNGSHSDVGFFNGGTNVLSNGEVQITCLPFAYGVKEQFGYTDSPIMALDNGTLVGNLNAADVTTNYIINPSFTADVLMENWTYNPAELDIQRLPEDKSLLDNDILVSNLTNSNDRLIQASITDTGDFFFFVLAKRVSGTGVVDGTTALLSLDGISVAPTVVKSPYKDYYMLFIKFTAGVPFTCGISISANAQVIIAHAQLTKGNLSNNYPYPFLANGDLLGHKWAGTRHASKSELEFTIKDGVTYEDANWLSGNFTINMWVTPLWEIPLNSTDAQLFKYDTITHGAIQFNIASLAFGAPFLEISASGMSGFVDSLTIEYNKPFMFTVIKGGVGAMRVYINGQLIAPLPASVQERDLIAGGTFEIGKNSNCVFDGFRVFDKDLTPTEIINLYNDEFPIKDGGGNLTNGLPSFYAYPKGQAGGMDGYNTVASVTVETKNHIAILGTNGDGSADVNMRLESVGGVDTNRLVLNVIPNDKQFIYSGNFYLDFQGSVADDPNNDYGVNMASISPNIGAGPPPKNSLQSGETFIAVFQVGLGGQPLYNIFPKASQRPRLLNGDISLLYRFLHVATPGTSIISRPVFGYGSGPLDEIYDYSEVGDVGLNYAQVAYDGFIFSLKSLDTIGKDSLNFGMKFVNNGPSQSFLVLDIIHIIKKPVIYLFNGLTSAGQSLVLTTNKPCLVEDSDGYLVNRGSIVSQDPLLVMPSKYVYVGFDWSTHTFNVRVLAQGEEVRKRSRVKLFLTPTYKF